MRFISLLLLGLIAFSACKKNNSQGNGTVYTPSCSGTKSFKNDVLPILNSSCNGCHSYNTYQSVSSVASSIRSDVANGSMPKNSTLSNSQKDAILCWIDNGMPNN
jgi:hypothetical protein